MAADEDEISSTHYAMNQQAPEAQVDVFRTILDLENRGQQIEEIVQRIKEVFLIARGGVSLPEAVGVLDELYWSTTHLAGGVRALEDHLGIRRKPVSSGPPRSTPKANHALRGSTRSIPMPDLIALLSAQRKTGTLYIKCRDERFVLELLDGEVVHVVSDSPRNKQRLGDILVAQQKISTDELEEFLSHYCRKDGRLGEALAKTKVVSEGDLRDALEYQVRELFRRVFALEEAMFSFQSGKMSDLQHRVSLNTTQLLLETARLEDEQRREAEEGPAEAPNALDAFDLVPEAAERPQGHPDSVYPGFDALSEPVTESADSPDPASHGLSQAAERPQGHPDSVYPGFDALSEPVTESADSPDPASHGLSQAAERPQGHPDSVYPGFDALSEPVTESADSPDPASHGLSQAAERPQGHPDSVYPGFDALSEPVTESADSAEATTPGDDAAEDQPVEDQAAEQDASEIERLGPEPCASAVDELTEESAEDTVATEPTPETDLEDATPGADADSGDHTDAPAAFGDRNGTETEAMDVAVETGDAEAGADADATASSETALSEDGSADDGDETGSETAASDDGSETAPPQDGPTDNDQASEAAGLSDQEAAKALQTVSGITRRTAKQLVRRGVRDVEGVRRATDRDLLAVPGIGHRTLRLIRQACEQAPEPS